jgi:hypothetical protein
MISITIIRQNLEYQKSNMYTSKAIFKSPPYYIAVEMVSKEEYQEYLNNCLKYFKDPLPVITKLSDDKTEADKMFSNICANIKSKIRKIQ